MDLLLPEGMDIEELDLSYKSLEELPDLSRYTKLKKIKLFQ